MKLSKHSQKSVKTGTILLLLLSLGLVFNSCQTQELVPVGNSATKIID